MEGYITLKKSVKVAHSLLVLFFEKVNDNSNLIEILCTIMVMYWGCGIVFIACEFGERMTNDFERFDEELERCGWHLLPIELQRMYLIFLSNTQQPKTVHCYGGLVCSRETYKKVSIHICPIEFKSNRIRNFFFTDCQHGILILYGSSSIRGIDWCCFYGLSRQTFARIVNNTQKN